LELLVTVNKKAEISKRWPRDEWTL